MSQIRRDSAPDDAHRRHLDPTSARHPDPAKPAAPAAGGEAAKPAGDTLEAGKGFEAPWQRALRAPAEGGQADGGHAGGGDAARHLRTQEAANNQVLLDHLRDQRNKRV